jgi:polyisoprenyl-teichoic acid--peptidoglycan teichoic acid transferase
VSQDLDAPAQQPGGSDAVPPAGSEGRGRGRRRARTFAGALGLTVAGTVLPGTTFLAAGRRWLGGITLVLFAALVAGGVWLATAGRETAVHWAVEADSLLWVIGAVAVVALAWVLTVVLGYRMITPKGTSRLKHALGALVVLALAAVVAVPAVEVGRLASIQRGLITGVFGDHRSATVDDQPNPFGDRTRINVLLLGGDSGPGREGVRTDTVIVASVNTRTGDTVLFSLPRNLENLPFPPDSPLAEVYPNGFTAPKEDEGLLNAVYRNGPALHPGLLGATDDEGADWLKLGVGQALGLHIDYYVMVNLEGFSRMVDALGGITVNVNYWVPINGIPKSNVLPDDYITPGPDQHLDGYHALQFARGRYGLTDYDRMARQRCVLGALTKAADPVTVLGKYRQLAETTQDMVQTDVPQSALDDFVDLGMKIKGAQVRSVVFDEHVITPAYPDYDKMRSIVQESLSPSSAAATTAPASSSAPAPTTAGPSGSEPAPGASPITDVQDACAYNPAQAEAALASGKPPTRAG